MKIMQATGLLNL